MKKFINLSTLVHSEVLKHEVLDRYCIKLFWKDSDGSIYSKNYWFAKTCNMNEPFVDSNFALMIGHDKFSDCIVPSLERIRSSNNHNFVKKYEQVYSNEVRLTAPVFNKDPEVVTPEAKTANQYKQLKKQIAELKQIVQELAQSKKVQTLFIGAKVHRHGKKRKNIYTVTAYNPTEVWILAKNETVPTMCSIKNVSLCGGLFNTYPHNPYAPSNN